MWNALLDAHPAVAARWTEWRKTTRETPNSLTPITHFLKTQGLTDGETEIWINDFQAHARMNEPRDVLPIDQMKLPH